MAIMACSVGQNRKILCFIRCRAGFCPIFISLEINYNLYLLFKKSNQSVCEARHSGHHLDRFAVFFVKADEDVVVCLGEVVNDTIDIGFHIFRELNI